ncbi:SDR family oxidoreductase [Planosporangium flavigriseum]|uniref:Oxidoreductase n=1 Tax=Planosporangium flavigriseum TaxID=373681 RepID=A0A8J3PNG5_9ACTN|nr:SDR family oxidoreductase [Planosporangium flavigriseum]NJC67566.1 SDR family oxidoreductase [Planosporangium flavigriseum]GIG75977.1 oxidoreductase [Planosporangium flavigriseum]
MTSQSLAGKTVLVTGAARGIGEHTARVAAARGARVALVGLEPERLAAVARDLNAGARDLNAGAGASADAGDRHVWYECDVTDQASLEQAVRGTVEALGGIDAVVANAGVANRGTIAVGDIEAFVRTVDVNLIGVMRTVGATVEHVIASRGYFLLVSSAAAFTVLPGMAAYCASKAGVEQFGNAIRLELAHRGVAVGTAHPVWIDTDMVRDAKDDLPEFGDTLRKLPWPLNTYTSVEACATAFVDGIERRRRRIYVPRAIAAIQALRTITTGPIADAIVGRAARRSVPLMEEQVRKLGRAFGAHTATSATTRERS